MTVVTGQKALVGRVSEVYDNFSRVILISNKESSFNAEIQGRDVSGAVKGKGNFKIFIDLIPQEKEIKEGDVIITSPLGEVFPKGLVVGQIGKILKSDIDPFQQAQINPAFDIQRIELLFIILGY
jgi:rod shape-determining protein MreC